MALDIPGIRAPFPSLSSGVAPFDGAGGTQAPDVVGEAVAATLTGPLSNRGGNVLSELNADQAVAAFRSAFADFLGADPRGVAHGRPGGIAPARPRRHRRAADCPWEQGRNNLRPRPVA